MGKIKVENEFGILAVAITRLAEEIDRYTRDNIHLAAEHERLATELNLATRIQKDALPAIFTDWKVGCENAPRKKEGFNRAGWHG